MRERVDEVLEQAGVGMAQLDPSGRYLFANDSFCRMVGRRRQELLETGMQDIAHPDDLPLTLDAFIRAIETGATRVVTQRYLRDDGTAVRLSHIVSPVYDSAGKPEFVLVLAHEGHADTASDTSDGTQADVRTLLDVAADGFYCVDRSGRTTLSNAAFRRMLGFQREEDVAGRHLHEVVRLARPDGSPYGRDDSPIAKAVQSGTPAHVADEMVFRLDGSSFPAEYWVRPILREGQIEGAVCTFVDLTARKQAEARQELLNRELAHRVKNTLTMVKVIVGQTLRMSTTPQEALRSIDGRLVALGDAHSVLMRTRWGNSPIVDVIESAVALHRSEASRIQISGPRIDIGSKAALALTLALHELCTNAAKYGALSNDSGTVRIGWSVSGGAADARFRLTWTESGGPPVEAPKRKGFGSRLIAKRFGADFGGEAELRFEPAGVVWTLDAPLAAVRQ